MAPHKRKKQKHLTASQRLGQLRLPVGGTCPFVPPRAGIPRCRCRVGPTTATSIGVDTNGSKAGALRRANLLSGTSRFRPTCTRTYLWAGTLRTDQIPFWKANNTAGFGPAFIFYPLSLAIAGFEALVFAAGLVVAVAGSNSTSLMTMKWSELPSRTMRLLWVLNCSPCRT